MFVCLHFFGVIFSRERGEGGHSELVVVIVQICIVKLGSGQENGDQEHSERNAGKVTFSFSSSYIETHREAFSTASQGHLENAVIE